MPNNVKDTKTDIYSHIRQLLKLVIPERKRNNGVRKRTLLTLIYNDKLSTPCKTIELLAYDWCHYS